MSTRGEWVAALVRLATPPLRALAARRLHADMPHEGAADRRRYSGLEALGRTLAGVAPWLQGGGGDAAEEAQRCSLAQLALQALEAATDPASPDALNFTCGAQPVVDAAFLCLGLLRAPALWDGLGAAARTHLTARLRAAAALGTFDNNWVLFPAVIATCLRVVAGAALSAAEEGRIETALRKTSGWYLGDGLYSDGKWARADYYNSFVMHPMLSAVLRHARGSGWQAMREQHTQRVARYAAQLERCVAPDGSFPPLGRSLAYRCGAMHALAAAALDGVLPDALPPSQARCALTAVLRRTLTDACYDARGWLRVGLSGAQPSLGEHYICTGSLYLASAVFLPLGLPASNAFWSAPDATWTAVRAWGGAADVRRDGAIE